MEKFLYFLLVFTIIVLLLFESNQNDGNCGLKKDFLNEQFLGIVTGKYVDSSNHSFPTVEIKTLNGIEKFILMRYTSDSATYNFIIKNDSITKFKGNNTVCILRNSEKKCFLIDFRCK